MKAQSNYIDPNDFERIIESIPILQIRKWKDYDVEFLFKISYWCGLRMLEACELYKEDFDLNEQEVYLGTTKLKKNQVAIIPKKFIPELKYYLDTKQKGRLMPKCNPQIVRTWCKKLGVLLNIPAWTTLQSETGEKTLTHIFRKSIGKDMLYGTHGKKAPLNIVQRQLRHTSIETTNRYLKVHAEDVKVFWGN